MYRVITYKVNRLALPYQVEENYFHYQKVKIETWLKENQITQYMIKPDLKIDVFQDIALKYDLPDCVRFGKVTGSVYCQARRLKTLRGMPEEITGEFECSGNYLENLLYGPKKVGGNYLCSSNPLKSLLGAPEEVGGNFECKYSELESLEGSPRIVHGHFNVNNNKLVSVLSGPERVSGFYSVQANNLTTLLDCPTQLEHDVYAGNNTISDFQDILIDFQGHIDVTWHESFSMRGLDKFKRNNSKLTMTRAELNSFLLEEKLSATLHVKAYQKRAKL